MSAACAFILLAVGLLSACSGEGYPDIRTVPERPQLTPDAERRAMEQELRQERSEDLQHGEKVRRNPDNAPFVSENEENRMPASGAGQ